MNTFKTNLRGVYTIWYRDILRFWRDKARLFSSFAMPVLYLVIFGTGIASAFSAGEFDYISFMYPGIIGMVVIISAMFSGMTVVFDREFGFLKEVLVAPISRTSVVIGKVLGGATIATIQGLVMLVFIPFADVSITVGGGFMLVALMFMVALAITSMGLFIASRIRSMEAFQAMMQLLMFPLVFISPVMFPVETLPSWLGILVKLNPVSYGVDAMRQAVLGADASAMFGIELFGYRMPVILDAAVVVAFGLIMGALAIRSFRVQE
ncbi:MAG: ABC transporter permease [Chloroflexota bacterium]|nr:ABC transporter permease [Chloroflexota bacterium]